MLISETLLNLKNALDAAQLSLSGSDQQLADELKASYDAGYAAGLAAASGSDKIYSQAEVDAKIAESIAPLQLQINDLSLKLEAAIADKDASIAQSLSDLKASLLAQLELEQASELALKESFKSLLK